VYVWHLGLAVIAVDTAAVDTALPGKMVVEKEESLSNEVLIEGMDEVLSAVSVGGLELKSILSKGVLQKFSKVSSLQSLMWKRGINLTIEDFCGGRGHREHLVQGRW